VNSEEIFESEKNRKNDVVPFSGLFQIVKNNASTVGAVYMQILFPSIIDGRPLVFRPHIEVMLTFIFPHFWK